MESPEPWNSSVCMKRVCCHSHTTVKLPRHCLIFYLTRKQNVRDAGDLKSWSWIWEVFVFEIECLPTFGLCMGFVPHWESNSAFGCEASRPLKDVRSWSAVPAACVSLLFATFSLQWIQLAVESKPTEATPCAGISLSLLAAMLEGIPLGRTKTWRAVAGRDMGAAIGNGLMTLPLKRWTLPIVDESPSCFGDPSLAPQPGTRCTHVLSSLIAP